MSKWEKMPRSVPSDRRLSAKLEICKRSTGFNIGVGIDKERDYEEHGFMILLDKPEARWLRNRLNEWLGGPRFKADYYGALEK